MKHVVGLAAAAIAMATLTAPAAADDLVKMTIGQRGNWDTSITHLGEKAGIFKKHGLQLEMIYTSGSGETLQPVISGSVDLGLAVGTLGAMAAYSKGAPVRIIGAQATGAADYWYAKNPRDQDAEGHQRPHHRLFDQRLLDPQRRARLHRRVQAHSETAAHRQSERDAHRRDDRSGRRRLGRAAVRPEGDGGRQDPPRCARDRCDAGARADDPRAGGQCRRAGEAEGSDRSLHEGLPREHRLHVLGKPAGDERLC